MRFALRVEASWPQDPFSSEEGSRASRKGQDRQHPDDHDDGQQDSSASIFEGFQGDVLDST